MSHLKLLLHVNICQFIMLSKFIYNILAIHNKIRDVKEKDTFMFASVVEVSLVIAS